VFDIEAKNVATSPLATFLLHYICCETLGKLLIGSRANKPPYIIFQRRADGGLEVDLRKLNPVIQRLGMPLSDDLLDTVFLSEKKTAGQRSCRVLRNAVVHELHGDYVDEVNRRIAELIEAMTKFILEVRAYILARSPLKPYRGPPMTLETAAAAKLCLMVWCKSCGHRSEPDPAEQARWYGPETPVPEWRRPLVCSQCGSRNVDMVNPMILRTAFVIALLMALGGVLSACGFSNTFNYGHGQVACENCGDEQ